MNTAPNPPSPPIIDNINHVGDDYIISLGVGYYNEYLMDDFVSKTYAPELVTDLSLNKIFPIPEELSLISEEAISNEAICFHEISINKSEISNSISEEKKFHLVKNYGYWNPYDWCLNNWGTPLDIKAKMILRADVYVKYIFETISGLPIGWLKYVDSLNESFGCEMNYFGKTNNIRGKLTASWGDFENVVL